MGEHPIFLSGPGSKLTIFLHLRRHKGDCNLKPKKISDTLKDRKRQAMQIVQNLRIGTKLAVTSLLTILLIGGMILSEISGNAAVRQKSEAAGAQQTIA